MDNQERGIILQPTPEIPVMGSIIDREINFLYQFVTKLVAEVPELVFSVEISCADHLLVAGRYEKLWPAHRKDFSGCRRIWVQQGFYAIFWTHMSSKHVDSGYQAHWELYQRVDRNREWDGGIIHDQWLLEPLLEQLHNTLIFTAAKCVKFQLKFEPTDPR